MAPKLTRNYPMRLHISTAFLILVLVACGSISVLYYVKSRDMVSRETAERVDSIVSETTRELSRLFGPPETLVGLLSRSVAASSYTFGSRLETVHVLREALIANPDVASVYFGYPNGEFFQFRRLQDVRVREVLEAPVGAAWAVQSIDEPQDGWVIKQIVFLDKDLENLGTIPWETEYDPRQRSWYSQAMESERTVRGRPYVFYTDRKIGITFARSYREKGVVAGVDLRLETLSELMAQFKITPGSRVLLFEDSGELLAHEEADRIIRSKEENPAEFQRIRLNELDRPEINHLVDILPSLELDTLARSTYKAGGEDWLVTSGQLSLGAGPAIYFGMMIPVQELTSEIRKIMNQTVLLVLALVLAFIPITLSVSRAIARPISLLADEANAIRRLDFSDREKVRSVITEVHELSDAMSFMRKTISDFLTLIETLNRERNFDTLLERIANDVRILAAADGVLICLVDDEQAQLKPDVYCDGEVSVRSFTMPDFDLDGDAPAAVAVTTNKCTRWELGTEERKEFSLLFDSEGKGSTVWCEPLEDRQNNSMGIIGLVYHDTNGKDSDELKDRLNVVERLSGLAGVTLETKQLIQKQKELFDAFIKLIAGAIDAKSPYTGGHCQRVPVLAKMLAQAACDNTEGPFATFALDEEQWEELHVAAWLHDCGKVTTPEYVVDKATKLETIYDRIHEVRMRFEVLKRDAEIGCWKAVSDGAERDVKVAECESLLAQLDDEFAFIARCNEGGEFLADEMVERINAIGSRTWVRTLDDRIGISWEEAQRKSRVPVVEIPAEERLLSDCDEHLIIRTESNRIPTENPWGFKLDQPEHLYNRGEVYNLSVRRGTLSLEERFKINDHIVQTIKMLEELPYPKHLRGVPEIAGGHHETLHGTGYPRKLTGDQMSMTAKMMVIADVFEALTASDRPYKKAKKLSEAVHIMAMMQKGGHFDPDLYRLFLTSGIYRHYGEQYLEPSQLDDVDISQYLDTGVKGSAT